MKKFLPIFTFLFLSFSIKVSAQDITPSNPILDMFPTPQTLKTQGNIFSDIIDRLQNKQIYEEMDRVNKSMLPSNVTIEENGPQKGMKNNNQESAAIEVQAANSNSDTIPKVAGQYALGTGLNTPYEVSKINSNIFDWFGDILKSITSVFDKGNEEATKYVDLRTPYTTPVPKTQIDAEGSIQMEGVGGFAANPASDINMEKALSISRCSYLPFGICPENGELILEKLK